MSLSTLPGCHLIGYFSKEKHCIQKYNVSCIMVLPVYQKYGYGRFLIEFSYLLSKREEMAGTPEKPLSDLGRLSYESYWKFKVLEYIDQHRNGRITIENISKATGMNFVDIAATLQKNDLLKYREDKSGPKYEIVMNEQLWKSSKRPKITVNEEALRWTPLVFLSNQSNNESMETDAANDSNAHPVDEPDEQELKSGPVNSKSVATAVTATTNGQVVKKKKRRRWKNKTGFDMKKPRKKTPNNLTNGNGASKPPANNRDNHVEHEDTTSNSDNKTSKEDEEEEDATEADADSTEDEYQIESSDDEYAPSVKLRLPSPEDDDDSNGVVYF